MKRIRTLNEALAEIKQIDPRSAMTYNSIKQLCLSGAVKHFRSGNKILVNLDDLLRYMEEVA